MNADLRKLEQVFSAAKASFQYHSDMEVYRMAEHWVTPQEIRDQLSKSGVVSGDCDDFASLCVYLGRKLSLPMRFVLCLTDRGESHLVAEMGGWILDNRNLSVVPRDNLPYTWIAISDYVKGGPWSMVTG